MLLEVVVERAVAEDAVWLITVTGELDYQSAPRFKRAFSDATPPAGDGLVIDLSGLGFLDSSGLGALLELYMRNHDGGTRLAIVSRGRQIRRMLSVTDLDRLMPVTATREQAIRALTPVH